tara:strand:+ start:373 stop:627 length:255 start_codon:yes stop_codon:yes gene_type:complete
MKQSSGYLSEFFGRLNSAGNIDVLDVDGCPVQSLGSAGADVYPVDDLSGFSAANSHAQGIALTLEDAKKINLWIEDLSDGPGPS